MLIRLILISMLIILISSCETDRRNNAMELIQKVEDYQTQWHRLPKSLNEIGIIETESGPFYYQLMDSVTYQLSYGTDLGESEVYNSKTKNWN